MNPPRGVPPKPTIFRTPAALRAWLEQNHDNATELWIGFYRKALGKECVSYSDAVDLALCFGWIDGIRKKVDDITYTNRFTPRRPRSTWSNVNIRRVEALIAKGAMHTAGMKAFATHTAANGVYSFERRHELRLPAGMLKRFQARKRAWKFFTDQPPYYQRTTTHWVVSAKQEETRERRFEKLVDCSGNGSWIDGMVASKRRVTTPAKGKAT